MKRSRAFSSSLLWLLVFVISHFASAQDSTARARDTAVRKGDSTVRRERPVSLFSDTTTITSGEYMLRIEEVYQTLNHIENNGGLPFEVMLLDQELAESDTTLRIVKENISLYSNTLSLRNLQMYRVLLQDLQEDLKRHRNLIDDANTKLVGLKTEMGGLRKDTLLRQLIRDTAMRKQFTTQFRELRGKWRGADSLLRSSFSTLNQIKIHASAGSITASELLNKVDDMLNHSGERAFGNEYPKLWNAASDTSSRKLKNDLEKSYNGEKKALNYYFKHAGGKRLLLLLAGFAFFWWISRNLRRLKRSNKLPLLNLYDVKWLPAHRWSASFVVMFCVAPLFDLHAPAVYVESMQFLLLIALSFILWKQWPRRLFYYWLGVMVLFILFSATSHIIVPAFGQRCLLLVLNMITFGMAWLLRKKLPEELPWRKFMRFVLLLAMILSGSAILFNLFGRFSLSQIVGISAIFTLTQVIALSVFIRLWVEAVLLQLQASRIKRGVETPFEPAPVIAGVRKPVHFVAMVLWVIVFTTNMNIYTPLFNGIEAFLEAPRKMGSINFTFGSVALFFLIIWVAHLLQRFIGYFLGEAGPEEDDNEHQGTRSKLVVTRLLLLIGGYLLAIAASGLPVDKITIVLGALGVGIGMGLQNIVNNFVSGIILVFDRRLRVGDSIEVGDKAGRVKEISLRSSTLATSDGAEVIIPNGDILSNQIVNWTLSNNHKRMDLALTVVTSENKEVITGLIREAIAASSHVFQKREPVVLVEAISGNEFGLKVFFWCNDLNKAELARSEVLYAIYKQLDDKGIEVK